MEQGIGKGGVCRCQRNKLTAVPYLIGGTCIFVMVLISLSVIMVVCLIEYNKTKICTCHDPDVNIGGNKSDRGVIDIKHYSSKEEGSNGTSKTDCKPISWIDTCKACFSLKQQNV
ncbi:uncharacterized protein [Magallana gigas]|uniref:uncharacterized protein n=1 Tax=Magallana gigas TaxID=29159 RepID=UPI00334079B0